MENLLTGEIAVGAIFFLGLALVCSIGVPIIVILLFKDLFLNLASWVLIKMNTNFQYQNHFTFEDRHCKVIEIMWTKVIITDIQTGEYTKVSNKEFLNLRVWMRSAREKWNLSQKIEYHKKHLAELEAQKDD